MIILKEYEDILCGNRKDFSKQIFYGSSVPEKTAEEVADCIFTHILGWPPEKLAKKITYSHVLKWHLRRLFNVLPFPKELSVKEDTWYIAHILYPESVPYNKEDYYLEIYESVINKKRFAFPKSFFSGYDGELALKVCLNHALQKFLPGYTKKQLYELFADQKKGMDFMEKAGFKKLCREIYGPPLEMFHDLVDDEVKSDFFYGYYLFTDEMKKTARRERRKRK